MVFHNIKLFCFAFLSFLCRLIHHSMTPRNFRKRFRQCNVGNERRQRWNYPRRASISGGKPTTSDNSWLDFMRKHGSHLQRRILGNRSPCKWWSSYLRTDVFWTVVITEFEVGGVNHDRFCKPWAGDSELGVTPCPLGDNYLRIPVKKRSGSLTVDMCCIEVTDVLGSEAGDSSLDGGTLYSRGFGTVDSRDWECVRIVGTGNEAVGCTTKLHSCVGSSGAGLSSPLG